MIQLNVGERVDRHDLVTIQGKPVHLPDPERLVHLQFRRYAGCPVCNLHMRDVAARHDEILAAGIREVVVFYSDTDTMLGFQGSLPFATIADPEKKLYAEFGVGTMRYTGVLKPRTWRAALRGLAHAPSLRGIGSKGRSALGLPADFLIGTDGTILASNYGKYTDDHWSVDELLALMRGERTSR